MYTAFELANILFGMIGVSVLSMIGLLFARFSRESRAQSFWARRMETARALALPLDQRQALRVALMSDEMPVARRDEVQHLQLVANGLEVAEHIALGINNGVYERDLAIKLYGSILVRVFFANLERVYASREAESDLNKLYESISFYELERFVRSLDKEESGELGAGFPAVGARND